MESMEAEKITFDRFGAKSRLFSYKKVPLLAFIQYFILEFGPCTNTPRFSYPYGAMNFHGRYGN
jgi:hypothetical protein